MDALGCLCPGGSQKKKAGAAEDVEAGTEKGNRIPKASFKGFLSFLRPFLRDSYPFLRPF